MDEEDAWEARLVELFMSSLAEPGIDGPWQPAVPLWRSRTRPVDIRGLHRLVPAAEEVDLLEQARNDAADEEAEEREAWMTWPDTAASRRRPPGTPEHLSVDEWPGGTADWQ